MRLIFTLLLLTLAALPAYAAVSAAQLYEDCTAAHVPASARKSIEWVKVRRCENVVVAAVRALPWPLQVPSTIKWPEGATSDTLLICPNDSGSYDAPKLVEFYLKYWDRKSISFIGGRFQSSHASVVEAFSEQFQDCAKAEKK